MSRKVSPIPRGYRTATPCLTVFDVDSAVAFYQAAFGAEMLTRQTGDDESRAVHATIKIGNSIIIVNGESVTQGLLSPASLGGAGFQLHLYVDDIDTSWNRAIEAGAGIEIPVADSFWGDRGGVLVDGNGHRWSLASRIENVSQDEIARRAQQAREAEVEGFTGEPLHAEPGMKNEELADESLAV